MKSYSIKSNKTQSTLVFKYNTNGVLCGFEILENELTMEQTDGLLKSVFLVEREFLNFCKDKKVEVTTLLEDLSFDRFWKAYDYKQGKVKAAQEWNKMNDTSKAAAIGGIRKYKKNLPQGVALLYPERYLKYKRWED